MPARALVWHLIDLNLDTAFFRALVTRRDAARFDVGVGSLAAAGSLQERMRALDAPTFSCDAGGRASYPLGLLRLALHLRRSRAGLLHAHCFDPTLVGLFASRLAGVPFVFTRHHSDHNLRLGKRWHTRIDSFCARRADHVIAVSEATRRILIDVEGVPGAQITVVHNGMEPLTEPDAAAVEGLRRKLELRPGERVCLVVARLHEEKGHRVLFEALPRVQSEVGPVRVLLAGDGPHRGLLEAEAARRGLLPGVRFLGRRSDVPALIRIASVVVLPSLAESFGFAALEASSLGVPVVASRSGGLPEVVLDRETGLLAGVGSASELAGALVAVLRDEALARRLGEQGRQHARRFTAQAMVRGYEAVYDRVLARARKAASA